MISYVYYGNLASQKLEHLVRCESQTKWGLNKVYKDNNLERVTTNGCGADIEYSFIFLKNIV